MADTRTELGQGLWRACRRSDAQDVASVTLSVFWLQLIANRYVDVHTGPRSVGLSTLPARRTQPAASGERGVTGSLVSVSAGCERSVSFVRTAVVPFSRLRPLTSYQGLYGMLLNSAASVRSNTSCRVASSLTKLPLHSRLSSPGSSLGTRRATSLPLAVLPTSVRNCKSRVPSWRRQSTAKEPQRGVSACCRARRQRHAVR